MAASLSFVVPAALAVFLGGVPGASAAYQINNNDNIVTSARTIAFDLMSLYKGNQSGEVPGLLSPPPPAGEYYWYQGGGFMGAFIDYWRWTGDASYNDVVTQALLHQVGPNNNYLPLNYTAQMGNDDQCLWGLSAMLAAEQGFPNPPQDKPQWLALAQAVFDVEARRLQDEKDCNGGLRWMVLASNVGYDYKNTFANGCFLNLGARLARFTGNETYAKVAEQTWDWLFAVGLIQNESYDVFDGAHTTMNCTDINRAQFSYPAALITNAAAFMYNYTSGGSVWRDRVEKLSDATLRMFFPDKVAVETACESANTCTTDMLHFKGYLHRWLAVTTQVAPFTAAKLLPVLRQSTQAAVDQCTGGTSGRKCGFFWSGGKFVAPKGNGLGEELNVLSAVSSLLVAGENAPGTSSAPARNSTGPASGGGPSSGEPPAKPNSAARHAQAGVVAVLSGLVWCLWTVL